MFRAENLHRNADEVPWNCSVNKKILPLAKKSLICFYRAKLSLKISLQLRQHVLMQELFSRYTAWDAHVNLCYRHQARKIIRSMQAKGFAMFVKVLLWR